MTGYFEIDYWNKLSDEEKEFLSKFNNGDLPGQTVQEKRELWRSRKRWTKDSKRLVYSETIPEFANPVDTPEFLENVYVEAIDANNALPPKRKRRNRQKKDLGS